MIRIRRFFSSAPKYLLWIVLSTMFWMWIFTIVTDTSAEKKVTLFADVPALADPQLAGALEESMPEGIRMVKAHSFSYLMFDDLSLNAADIYIVKSQDIVKYAQYFQPADRDWAKAKADTLQPSEDIIYAIDGVPYGVKVYDADTGEGAAKSFVMYVETASGAVSSGSAADDNAADSAAPVLTDYYLCFGINSIHCGLRDTAAYDIADAYLALP